MRTNISILAILAFFLMSFQTKNEAVTITQNEVVCKVYTIKVPSTQNFEYVKLPKANFVRKMGGILSIKDLHQMEVRVKEHDAEKGKPSLNGSMAKNSLMLFPYYMPNWNRQKQQVS